MPQQETKSDNPYLESAAVGSSLEVAQDPLAGTQLENLGDRVLSCLDSEGPESGADDTKFMGAFATAEQEREKEQDPASPATHQDKLQSELAELTETVRSEVSTRYPAFVEIERQLDAFDKSVLPDWSELEPAEEVKPVTLTPEQTEQRSKLLQEYSKLEGELRTIAQNYHRVFTAKVKEDLKLPDTALVGVDLPTMEELATATPTSELSAQVYVTDKAHVRSETAMHFDLKIDKDNQVEVSSTSKTFNLEDIMKHPALQTAAIVGVQDLYNTNDRFRRFIGVESSSVDEIADIADRAFGRSPADDREQDLEAFKAVLTRRIQDATGIKVPHAFEVGLTPTGTGKVKFEITFGPRKIELEIGNIK